MFFWFSFKLWPQYKNNSNVTAVLQSFYQLNYKDIDYKNNVYLISTNGYMYYKYIVYIYYVYIY